MITITVTGTDIGPFGVDVKNWIERVGKKADLPKKVEWKCKHPFIIEFDDPQYIEFKSNYGAAGALKESAKQRGPSALSSLGAPRGAQNNGNYHVTADVIDTTPPGLYKYTVRVFPAGNEVLAVDPGYRVDP